MKMGINLGIGSVLEMLLVAAAASGQPFPSQAPVRIDPGPAATLTSAGLIDPRTVSAERIIRFIDDRSLGNRWLLCRDPEHPGGPGRLLLIASNWREGVSGGIGRLTPGMPAVPPATARPVIRSGDRLVIEEDSAVARARLAAVALESAVAGSGFHARLEIGGKVVRAVAVSAGTAVFAAESEPRP
jgi:hypothetical protein